MDTKKKILIVDDDIDIITVVRTILTSVGYEVIEANDKIEGIRKVKSEKPDLAILDVMMNPFTLSCSVKNQLAAT